MRALTQNDLISQYQIRKLYEMSVSGLYSDKLLNTIITKLIDLLKNIGGTPAALRATSKLSGDLSRATTDNEKMIAIDAVIHYAHTSGFYAQHLIQGKDKVDIMNFLAEIAGISDGKYEILMEQLNAGRISTAPPHTLYSTIDLTGFEDLNKGAIRDTRARFEAMKIKEYSFTDKTLLDIGCNVGHMLIEATTCGFPISHGIEHISHIASIGNAIMKYLRISDRVKIQCASADELTPNRIKELTGKDQFDIIFCFAVDGYVTNFESFYKFLATTTKEVLYFEPNNHRISWNVDLIKSWGFESVEKITVPYDKNNGSIRDCFICHK